MTTDVDINDLALDTEQLGEGDVAAAEASTSYAPTIPTGSHTFIFSLDEEKPFRKIESEGKLNGALEITFTGTIAEGGQYDGRTVRYNRANTYRSEKMKNSRAHELLFALGKLEKFNSTGKTARDLADLLAEAEGESATFRGTVIWEAYDKDSGLTLSTSPQKGYTKGDGTEVPAQLAWPKRADGTYDPRPEFPNGNPAQGREKISRVSPAKGTKTA